MQNFSAAFTKRQNFQCLWPCCNCEKCIKSRLQAKHAESCEFKVRNRSADEVHVPSECNSVSGQTVETTNTSLPFAKYKIFTYPNLSMPTFKFTPHDFSSVLCDLVGIISFFIMASIMFWITISQHLWNFAKKLLQAERNIKLLILALFVLLCASITFHVLTDTQHRKQSTHLIPQTSNSTQPSSDRVNPTPTIQRIPKRFHRNCHHKKCLLNNSRKSIDRIEAASIKKEAKECEKKIVPSDGKSLERKTPSLCDLCAAKFKAEGNRQPSLSDEEARAMYKRYKLYSIPIEMKFPPSFGCVFEIVPGFFSALFNRTFF